MPSTRARSLPRPPGMIPSGVSEPAIAPPTAPTSPSPLITTGTSPASTASSACSTPCSRPLVRWTRNSTRRASSACSTRGSSFSVLPAGRGRVDQQRQWHPLDVHAIRSLIGRRRRLAAAQAPDREAAVAGRGALDRLDPAAREAPAQQPRARPPRRRGAAGAGEDQVAAGPQHPGDLGRRRAGVDAGRPDRSGRRGRAARRGGPALKATRPSGSRPTRAVARPHRLLGAVDAAHPRRAGTRGRGRARLAVAALDHEDPLRARRRAARRRRAG